ncbi:MAG TPA: hypothetical protein VKP67_07870 [Xanthobacteraceae bacterium]|nr:hypothetical protein [Xanthobacteraceae bacterium]
MARSKTTASLATALLLGRPACTTNGWYSKRKYLKPGRKRESAARVALAIELRKEAPDGYFVQLLAKMIDPRTRTHGPVPKQTIKFVPPKGGRRASHRADLDIVAFMREQLARHPARQKKAGIDAAAWEAHEHFDVSERRVWQAWELFGD